MFLIFLACTSDKESSISSDDSGSPAAADCSGGGVLFTPEGGVTESWDVSGGSSGSPVMKQVTENGVVTVCGGTSYVTMDVTATSLVVSGDTSGERPVLSGGGIGEVIQMLTSGSTLIVEDVDLIEGYGCLGAAVLVGDIPGCVPEAITPVTSAVELHRVGVHLNDYNTGGGAVGLTGDSTLLLDDTEISGNIGHGVYAINADVTCIGSTASRAGMWGNEKFGIWMEAKDSDRSYTLDSQSCDFGVGDEENGFWDVQLQNDYDLRYDDDATFTCDVVTKLCTPEGHQ